MTRSGAALVADRVIKKFGETIALHTVTLRVAPGESVALVGESGSGKSTLLRAFNALTRLDSGRVTVDEMDVALSDPVELRRRIGYVQQDGGLLPHWTVRRNAELVPTLRGFADASARATEALALVGLDPTVYGSRYPRELSGGQRQRVAIARALAAEPDAVLLDEPFGALDAITRGELRASFAVLRSTFRITTVLVTHDLAEAIVLADRIVVLRHGSVLQDATPAALLAAPANEYVATLLRRAGVLS